MNVSMAVSLPTTSNRFISVHCLLLSVPLLVPLDFIFFTPDFFLVFCIPFVSIVLLTGIHCHCTFARNLWCVYRKPVLSSFKFLLKLTFSFSYMCGCVQECLCLFMCAMNCCSKNMCFINIFVFIITHFSIHKCYYYRF